MEVDRDDPRLKEEFLDLVADQAKYAAGKSAGDMPLVHGGFGKGGANAEDIAAQWPQKRRRSFSDKPPPREENWERRSRSRSRSWSPRRQRWRERAFRPKGARGSREGASRRQQEANDKAMLNFFQQADKITKDVKTAVDNQIPKGDKKKTISSGDVPLAATYGLNPRFQWDHKTGCFLDAMSGFYFDIHKHLYFFQGKYYEWVESSGKYVAVEDEVRINGPKSSGFVSTQPTMPNQPPTAAVAQPAAKAAAPVPKKAKPVGKPIGLQKGYIDMQRLCCLLCKRKFKTEQQIRKHELFSDLHRKNIAAKREEAAKKTKAQGGGWGVVS